MRSESSPTTSTFTERARRTQITSAAIEVLATSGFAATSLAAIAAQLNISKGVISYHFRDKAELLNAVAVEVLASAAAWMTPPVAASTSYAEALRTYIAANLRFLDDHRNEIFALVEILTNARAVTGIPELFGRSQAEAVDALEQLIRGGASAGEFVELDPHVTAVSLRASIDALTAIVRVQPDFSFGPFEAGLIALFERALLVSDPTIPVPTMPLRTGSDV